MPVHGGPSALTLTERISCVVKLLALLYHLPAAAINYPLLPEPKPPFHHIIHNTAIKHVVQLLSSRQLAAVLPSSFGAYSSFCKDHNIPLDIEELGPENPDTPPGRLFWLGPRWDESARHSIAKFDGNSGPSESTQQKLPDRKVLLYIHGGGFQVPLAKSHMNLCAWLRQQVGEDVSIALLEYGLTPRYKYPTQLRQCAAAVDHFLKRGLRPENLCLAGDSAGGQIILSFLSHCLHPHPSIPPVDVHAPLSTAILISPAANLRSKTASMENMEKYDMLCRPLCYHWTDLLVVPSPYDKEINTNAGYWGSASVAPVDWWKGLERVVSKVRVTAGGCEILRDDIVTFQDKLVRSTRLDDGFVKVAGKKVDVEMVVAEKESHDAFMVEFGSKWKGVVPGESVMAIGKWVKEFAQN